MYKFEQFSRKNFEQLYTSMKSQPQTRYLSLLSTNPEISIVSLYSTITSNQLSDFYQYKLVLPVHDHDVTSII